MPLLNKFETKGSNFNKLAGKQPTAPLSDGSTLPVNNTFSKGTYVDYVSDAPRAVDTTGNNG